MADATINWTQLLQGSGKDFVKSYGTIGVARDQNGNLYWVAPTGKVIEPIQIMTSAGWLSSRNMDDNMLADAASKMNNYVNTNYIINSKGQWDEVYNLPNGSKVAASDYTVGQGATYDATGQPSQNTPTSGAGTATPTPAATTASTGSTLNIATVPNSTNNLPAGYRVTGQEPSGWATDPNGHMVKITDIPGASAGSTGGTTTPPATDNSSSLPTGWTMDATGHPVPPAGGTTGEFGTNGSTGSTGGTTGTGTTLTGDPAAQRAALTAAGIDPTLLSDSQVSALYLMQTYTDSQAQKDKQIAPASLTQADMDKFLSDAKAEYDPYYQGQFDIAKNNLLQAVGQVSGDNTYLEQTNAANFTTQNEAAAKQAAAAGLARSGIRQLAEQRLAEQQTGLVESGRRKAQSDIYNLGSSFEKDYGASGLANAGGAPSISSAGNAALGIAPTTIGYTPIGVAGGGTQGAAQTTAELQEQSRLAQLEASKRLNNAYGSTATNLP